MSPRWRAYTGQAPEEARGPGRLDAVHPDDRERAQEAWRRAEANQHLDVEFRLRRADGG